LRKLVKMLGWKLSRNLWKIWFLELLIKYRKSSRKIQKLLNFNKKGYKNYGFFSIWVFRRKILKIHFGIPKSIIKNSNRKWVK
jgi:hypothetical protein